MQDTGCNQETIFQMLLLTADFELKLKEVFGCLLKTSFLWLVLSYFYIKYYLNKQNKLELNEIWLLVSSFESVDTIRIKCISSIFLIDLDSKEIVG